MSFITTLLPFLVKEAPHAEDLLTAFETITAQARTILNELPAAEREVQAAMTALETTAQQGLNAIAKLGKNDAAAVTKAVESVVTQAKATVKTAVATAKK